MKRRNVCLLGVCFVWGAGAAALACSSTSGDDTTVDGGKDTSTTNDVGTDMSTTKFDVEMPEASSDVGHEQDAPGDAGTDAGGDAGDAGHDAGLVGHCSAVNTACDLVLQDCPKGKECVVVTDKDGGYAGLGTQCQATKSSEHLPIGSLCKAGSSNPCDPGMTCENDRCTPACCPTDGGSEIANCGTSPEGYVGTCTLDITTGSSGSEVEYTACTYDATCTVFAQPCSKGYTCDVDNKAGKSGCDVIAGPKGYPKGGVYGTSCEYLNSCEQGLACITFGSDDAGTCSWMCYRDGGAPPFDAAIINDEAGGGGCPAKSICEKTKFWPSWLGICTPPS